MWICDTDTEGGAEGQEGVLVQRGEGDQTKRVSFKGKR